MLRYNIIKIDAKKLIDYCALKESEKVQYGDYKPDYKLDLTNSAMFDQVVIEVAKMDTCALYEQLVMALKVQLPATSVKDKLVVVTDALKYTLVVLDFSGVYSIPEYQNDKESEKRLSYLEHTEKLIENGFILQTAERSVHMMPFDKNDNMSRECKITFLDESKADVINERLMVGIDFTSIKLPLSKYYAYRGLYLSTSNPTSVKLNEETVVVVKDKLTKFTEYQKETDLSTAEAEVKFDTESTVNSDAKVKYTFRTEEKQSEKITKPYDGQGFISPRYANDINAELGYDNAHSFQIRLPFAKGMLHTVDFHAFFSEFDKCYESSDTYMMEDCFGIERDLKKAQIIMTESMFKCAAWLAETVKSLENYQDPMKYYFDRLRDYGHKLFVSNTDLPYGKTRVVRLSYQMLNTLKLEKQFNTLVDQHLGYMKNPIDYLKLKENYTTDEKLGNEVPVWKRALFLRPEISGCNYVKRQLENEQRALLGQLAKGKMTVTGQMRFLARDLPYMLVRLLRNHDARVRMKDFKLYDYRFFMPQGDGENSLDLVYENCYGFLRSPHLSRNEQCALMPFIPSTNPETINSKSYNEEQVKTDYEILKKYFGHLTGVVMVGNQSLVPLAMGGADFDGDLVEVIFDKTVNAAILSGVYGADSKRKLPYIKIPSNQAANTAVPKHIPYVLLNNTFANKIGLISDAAVEIGQWQYGNAEKPKDIGELECEMCTILTGLEIDAAKHGKHPDLSMVEQVGRSTPFLKFLRDYEKMKKKRDFHQNQLKFRENPENQSELELKFKENVIRYPKEVTGTHINKLPIVFMENLKLTPYKSSKKQVNAIFALTEEEKKQKDYQTIKAEIDTCLQEYKKTIVFYERITSQMQEYDKCIDNLTYLLTRMYEDSKVNEILNNKLLLVKKVVKQLITPDNTAEAIQRRINDEKWHLQLKANKEECLKKILDTDQTLNGEEWAFVYEQRSQGYKVLWYIVESLMIENNVQTLLADSDDLSQDYVACFKNIRVEEFMKQWSGSGVVKEQEQVFHIAVCKIRDISATDITLKIKTLFAATKEVQERRIFWECFSWEEIKSVIDA